MYTAAKENGSVVIAATMTPFGNFVSWSAPRQAVLEAVNSWILNTATDVDYTVDLYPVFDDPANPGDLLPEYDSGDGLHMTTAGYYLVADTLYADATWTPDPTTYKINISAADIGLSQSLRPSDSPRFYGLNVTSPNGIIDFDTPTIAVGTDNPQRPLDVRGDNLVLTSNDQYAGNALIMTSSAYDADVGGSLGLGGKYTDNTITGYWTFAALQGVKEAATAGVATGALDFYTSLTGNIFRRMRLSSVGKLTLYNDGLNIGNVATTTAKITMNAQANPTNTTSFVAGVDIPDYLLLMNAGNNATFAKMYGSYFGQITLYSAPTGVTITEAAAIAAKPPLKSVTLSEATKVHGILVIERTGAGGLENYGITVNAPSGTGANYAAAFLGGNTGFGTDAPTGMIHIVSPDAAAQPALLLAQNDVSEEIIEITSTAGTGNAIELIGAKTLTVTEVIKVTINGNTRYIPAGTIA